MIGFHFGRCFTVWVMTSTVRRRLASGPKMKVPRERYSFTMSFWVVPARTFWSTPCSSASAMYIAISHMHVALMVIDVFISSSGICSNRVRISPRWGTGTPTLPTSPHARTWSGSYPVWVGRSNATERPVCPLARFWRYSALDAFADEWPE